MTEKSNSIVIYGNDLHALSAAMLIANAFSGAKLQVTLVCPPAPIIEKSVSLFADMSGFLKALDISEQQLLSNCDGTFSLGTQFTNLPNMNKPYFQSFGGHGGPIEMVAFQHFVFKKQGLTGAANIEAYSLNCQMAKHNKFVHPNNDPRSILSTIQYGINVSGTKLHELLTARCKALGVTVINSTLTNALDTDAKVATLSLSNNDTLHADVLINCMPNSPYSCSHLKDTLDFDRKVCFEVPRNGDLNAYNTTSHINKGWLRKVVLNDCDAFEFTYNSQHYDEQSVCAMLSEHCALSDTSTFTHHHIHLGFKQNVFSQNQILLGRAAYFMEEIEYANLHHTIVNTHALLSLLPHNDDQLAVSGKEYTRKYCERMQNIADYMLLKYVHTEHAPAHLAVASFKQKLEYFSHTGQIAYFEEEILHEPYRVSAFVGANIQPSSYDYLLERFDYARLDERFTGMANLIQNTVTQMPDAKHYLQQFLAQ